ncbi:MAG: hypothetical protein ACOZAO_04545 [Patescibacteria group bacterium]
MINKTTLFHALLGLLLTAVLLIACGPQPTSEVTTVYVVNEETIGEDGWEDIGDEFSVAGFSVEFKFWGTSTSYGCLTFVYLNDKKVDACSGEALAAETATEIWYFRHAYDAGGLTTEHLQRKIVQK